MSTILQIYLLYLFMINGTHSLYIDQCKYFSTHLTYSFLYMITFINTSSTEENGESVLFRPVLKAYPTWHSWLIIAHISLGHLEWHWKSFTRQMDRTHQIIQSLSWWSSAPTQLLSAQQPELTNINYIYISYKPIIIPAINLLATDPSSDGNANYIRWVRRSLLPFFGETLSWLTGTATT